MDQIKSVEGRCGISATMIADSISDSGVRMTTMELVYHRYCHGEALTHRMLSKNSSSSRAVPLQKAIENVLQYPAIPTHWGKKQSGMQAKEELSEVDMQEAAVAWGDACSAAIHACQTFDEIGGHKQWAARPLEPFQMMKVVCSATDWKNFLWLRDHEAAQPEIQQLAWCIDTLMKSHTPEILYPGEWHVPYVHTEHDSYGVRHYFDADGNEISVEQALRLSASCCAQVSYRRMDDSIEKADAIFRRLIESDRVHASPCEHQATPIAEYVEAFNPSAWDKGITHVRKDGTLYSGNLREWIQHRQLLDNHCVDY